MKAMQVFLGPETERADVLGGSSFFLPFQPGTV
jgi:hypothetical protein